MEKIPWVQLPAPKESESPLELYLEIFHLIAKASHYICAPITSPAGLKIEASNVAEIMERNWERNVATLLALMQSKAFDASLVYMPAVIGKRSLRGRNWSEFDFNKLNTMVYLRLTPQAARKFNSFIHFTEDELALLNNYADQGKVRAGMYDLLGVKSFNATSKVSIDPMTLIAFDGHSESFGCKYETELANKIKGNVYETQIQNEVIRLVKRV